MTLVNAPIPRETDGAAARDRSRLFRLLVTMAFVSLTLAAVFGRHGLLDAQRYRAERDRLAGEIRTMEAEQRRLEAEVAAIGHDTSGLERIAREQLGLARPGEVVILLKPVER